MAGLLTAALLACAACAGKQGLAAADSGPRPAAAAGAAAAPAAEQVSRPGRYQMATQDYLDTRLVTVLDTNTGEVRVITLAGLCENEGCKKYNFRATGISYLTLSDGKYTQSFQRPGPGE